MRGALVAIVLAGVFLASGCGDGSGASAEGCENVEKPPPRKSVEVPPPKTRLDETRTYVLNFRTTCGTFVVTLDMDLAPNTAASLVKLARTGYFDGTIFHRIVPDFVIQGGDPTQTGGGGPGYWMRDVPPPSARYTKGTVAMAKRSDEAPGLAGSQFFVVTAGDAGLPAVYAIVGKVTQGMDVVRRIGRLGDEMEQPTQTVLIRKVLVVSHRK
jgi:cyclophilin family peptidyl-prolyl cis-trans isomerase